MSVYSETIEKSSATPVGWSWGAIRTDAGGNARWIVRDADGAAVLVHEGRRHPGSGRLSEAELIDALEDAWTSRYGEQYDAVPCDSGAS